MHISQIECGCHQSFTVRYFKHASALLHCKHLQQTFLLSSLNIQNATNFLSYCKTKQIVQIRTYTAEQNLYIRGKVQVYVQKFNSKKSPEFKQAVHQLIKSLRPYSEKNKHNRTESCLGGWCCSMWWRQTITKGIHSLEIHCFCKLPLPSIPKCSHRHLDQGNLQNEPKEQCYGHEKRRAGRWTSACLMIQSLKCRWVNKSGMPTGSSPYSQLPFNTPASPEVKFEGKRQHCQFGWRMSRVLMNSPLTNVGNFVSHIILKIFEVT